MRRADFRRLMGSALIQAVEQKPDTTYGVWQDGTLAYINPAWSQMARDNQGDAVLADWPLGRNVWEAVPPVLHDSYRQLWDRALQGGRPVEHRYECSSPTQQRFFRMLLHPIGKEAVLVRNHLVVAHAHPDPSGTLSLESYRNEAGFVTMCANCRRVRRTQLPVAWDWVPDFVAHAVLDVSHGLCEACLELYYPEPRATHPAS